MFWPNGSEARFHSIEESGRRFQFDVTRFASLWRNGRCIFCLRALVENMKLFFCIAVFAVPLCGQQFAHPSLAPIRAEAHKAFTAEMDRAAKGDCLNLETSAAVNDCYERALAQSESNLKAFRAAIGMSIKARQDLFGAQLLRHFESSEQAWDGYSVEQAQVTADLVDNPADKSGSAAATQIDLIRTHMRDLDKIYNILLHENCGACLTNQ